MNRQHYSTDNSSDLETSPSDIIEIEESPVKSKKKKKKKTFSFDSTANASTSSSPQNSKRGKISKSTTRNKSTYISVPSESTGKLNLTNTPGNRGVKRKTASSNRESQEQGDSDTSSDDEYRERKSRVPTGKRVRRGLAKRLYGNNNQASKTLPSGSGIASQDGWYSTTKASQPSTSHSNSQISARDSHKPNSQISARDSHKPNSQISARDSHKPNSQISARDSHKPNSHTSARDSHKPNTQFSKRDSHQSNTQFSKRDSHKSNTQFSKRDSHKSNSYISSRQSHGSTAYPYNFTKLSSDSDVVKETVDPPHKKCITYHDSDPASEGFEPSISDEAIGQLSSSNSSDDLFQNSAKRKSLPKKMVSSSDETTVDSDVTIMESPEYREAHMLDSDATIIDSPVHQELTDTQLPDLTLKFMSSSSEEEPDRNIIPTSRQKSDNSKKPYQQKGKQGEDQLVYHKTPHTNNNSQGPGRNFGDSQESESLFGKLPSLSQHIQDDLYKFPSQSQDGTHSMPSLQRMSNTNRSAVLGSEVKQEPDLETTTDSDADVPLASLSVDKYKSTHHSSVKRQRDSVVDDEDEFNPWPQSRKRFRQGSYSQGEGNESATQNYSLGQETIHSQSGAPNIKSEVVDREILTPKTEPPSYGYTQDLDVTYIEDSDSDYEDMSQKIVEISSDEDDKLQHIDDADEFKSYFNLSDCDSDDNDLQVLERRRDEDVTSSSGVSNIDWVSVDSDDDFSYGLLTQQADVDRSVYDQPTQIDTADRVRFIEEVVTFEESDDEYNDPYELATQVDGEEQSRVDEQFVYNTDTQVDGDGVTKSDEDLYEHCTQIDTPKDKHKENKRYGTRTKVAGQQDGAQPSEMDSIYSVDTQLDDVGSRGGPDVEMDSVYSADTQLDDDYRPEVYIDVDDKEEVCVKVEPIDITEYPHRQHTEIDPFDLCVPIHRGPVVNVKPKHHNVRMAQPVEKRNMSALMVSHPNSSSSAGTHKSNKPLPKTQGSNQKTYISTECQSRAQVSDKPQQYKHHKPCLSGQGHNTDSRWQTQVDEADDDEKMEIKNRDTDDNFYMVQTQIDVIDHSTTCAGVEEDSIYTAQTQVDGAGFNRGTDDEEDDVIYTAQTQVDGADIIRGTDDEEDDVIYTAQTQVDGADIIRGTDDEEDDVIYTAQTQVDGAGFNRGTDDEEDDVIYTAQTQVDGAGLNRGTDDEEDDDIYTAQTQVDGADIIRGTDDEGDDVIYTAQTQVDGAGFNRGTDDEEDDVIYTAQTQVDGAGLNRGTDDEEDDDIYTAQTQVDGADIIRGTDDEGDDVIYTAQTQVDGAGFNRGTDDEEDDDIYTAQTQVDGTGFKPGTDDEEDDDIYTAQTQVDGTGVISMTDDEEDNIYTAQTQVDDISMFTGTDDKEEGVDTHVHRNEVKGQSSRCSDSEDISLDQTRVKGLMSRKLQKVTFDLEKMRKQIMRGRSQMSNKEAVSRTKGLHRNELSTEVDTAAEKEGIKDPYLAATQIDGGADLSSWSDEGQDLYMASTQIDNITISSTESDVRDNIAGDITISSTEGDNHMGEVSEEDTEPYNIATQYDLPSVDSSVTPRDKYQEKEKSLVKSIDKIRFQNLISVKKTVLPTEPQRLKTTAEKGESFRIEKSSFYSKKSTDTSVQRPESEKPSTSGWLSTSTSVNSRNLPKVKGSRSKRQQKVQLDNSQQIKDKMYVARTQMSNRQQNRAKPTAHRNTSLTASTGYDTDVQLPNPDEIQAKQLPLLSLVVPTVKDTAKSSLSSRQPHTDTVDVTGRDCSHSSTKGTPLEENDKMESEKEWSHLHNSTKDKRFRFSSTDSESSKKDNSRKERSHRQESGSSKNYSRNKERSPRPESGSSKNDSRNKERSQRPESGSSKNDSRNKERSQSTETGSRKNDSRNKERSQRPESGSSKNDSRNKERSQSTETGLSKNDSKNKERSPGPESGSSKNDSRNKERSQRPESGSSKNDSRNKERSQSTETGSRKNDSRNKERSPRPESGSSKNDSRNKERSPRPESGSSKNDSRNKERSQRPESGSSKNDSKNKERSQSTETGSSKNDSRNKERSTRPESGSSKNDSRNKERSQSKESRSYKTDSREKALSKSTDSGPNKNNSRNKERSPRPEIGSSKNDSRNKERSPRPESGSSKNDSRNKERSPRPESGSSKNDSRNKEWSQSTETRSCKNDSRNKETSSRPESGSSKIDNRNERSSRSVITENNKKDGVMEERSLSLESITSEEINIDDNIIPCIDSNKKPADTCLLNGLSKKIGTKENMPPTTSVTASSTTSHCDPSVSKSSIPATTANVPLPKPRVGKMIRRPATRPKSILSHPENRASKKPGRRVAFDLPDKVTNPTPVLSKLARSILAREERLPELHHLRRPGKATNPVGPLNRTEGTYPHVSSVKSARPTPKPSDAVPKRPVPPLRPPNLMEKCSSTVMKKPLTDITVASHTNTPDKQYSLDNLLVKLLKWNPVWLLEQEKCPFPPPAIEEENPLFSLSESYSHFDDYIRLFTPHILMETWETTVCGYKKSVESGNTRHRVHLSAVQTSADGKFLHYTWNGVVKGQKFSSGEYPCEADLVIFNYVSEEPDPAQPRGPPRYVHRSTFSFIERVTHHKAQDIPRLYDVLPLLREDAQALGNQNVATLKLKLKIRNGRNIRVAPQPASIQRVVSLVSIVRQYNALVELRRNVLWRHILEPGRTDVFSEVQPVTDTLRIQLRGYNPSQQKAICTAAKVAMQPVNLPRICLLQGPPGTGKSHTIVGIVDKIIRDTQGKGRICLCTPSNAAVDEVIRRLILHKKRLTRDPNQLPYGLHVVRIGKMSSVHKDVAKHTFSEIVNGHIQNEIARKKEKNFPQSSQRELASLAEKISVLSHQLEQMGPVDTSCVHRKRLQADLQKLEQKKADLKYQYRNINKSTCLTPSEEYEIKKNVLWRAHVICGTLNSFGSGNIQNLLRSRHPGDQSSFFFNCIVMDEASQATELDCLIPLQYGTSKLIMVGDPEQLSPTVLSRKAEQKCFGQSMFERMYGFYKYKDSNPVLLLDTQYRMNPEIATFPSQYVYGGRLLSDRCVEERGQNFPLKPYLVFNMAEGQEQSSQAGSIKNEDEAHFVAMLCHKIIRHTDIPQTDIGIIAPYQSQKSLVLNYLRQWKMASIEVGTVDGFQGREKEVIIMSCTRASSSGGIGFVANRKRMNVALTRAKSAMYVVGNLSSLERSEGDWKILIDNARTRSVILECGSRTNFSTVIMGCFKRMPT